MTDGAHVFALPDVGEGLTEAEIVRWLVEAGDDVALNQVIVEIESAKSLVELPSPFAGVVQRLHHPEGAVIPVGAPLITVGSAAAGAVETATDGATVETATDGARVETDTETETDDEPRPSVLVGYGPTSSAVARRPRRPGWLPPSTGRAPRLGRTGYAKPPVRKLAKDLGVELDGLRGSGPDGEVTRNDVRGSAGRGGADAAPREVRIPLRGVRRSTAAAMVASAFTAPHASVWTAVDVTRGLRLLRDLADEREWRGVRLTPLLLVARAAVLAMARHPELNASWDDAAGEIVRYRDVDLGVAVATERGLLVPHLRAAQTRGLADLARDLGELVTTAREGRATPEQSARGSLTLTNVGVFGVDGGLPILNPGEASILCMGQIQRQPWAHRGRVRLRDVMTLTLSFDHRLVDGELGARYLADVAALLHRPDRALSW
jgi:2-oxoisovalerate dehydrogenase E2 component (dihydrolipoyl transacylase)